LSIWTTTFSIRRTTFSIKTIKVEQLDKESMHQENKSSLSGTILIAKKLLLILHFIHQTIKYLHLIYYCIHQIAIFITQTYLICLPQVCLWLLLQCSLLLYLDYTCPAFCS